MSAGGIWGGKFGVESPPSVNNTEAGSVNAVVTLLFEVELDNFCTKNRYKELYKEGQNT